MKCTEDISKVFSTHTTSRIPNTARINLKLRRCVLRIVSLVFWGLMRKDSGLTIPG